MLQVTSRLFTNIRARKALVQYFGYEIWIDEIEDDEFKSNKIQVLYTVYNDNVAEDMQIGIIFVVYDDNYKEVNIEIKRDII